jgi:glycosyltransferase involved in cell wall biosynthesis
MRVHSVGSRPFVSIIVPTFNRADSLSATLGSLANQSYDRALYEIIVVDNNSLDHTRTVVEDCRKTTEVAVVYVFEGRQGVHYARNAAFGHTKGEILYFTDDDMIADCNLISEIIQPFAYDPKIAVCTGPVLPKWKQDPPIWVKELCLNELLSLQTRPEIFIVSPTDCGVYSCHEAIRRGPFWEAGGFNPENTAGVWIGDGETGLHIKLKELGYWFAFTSSAITYHVIPPERMTQSYLNARLSNQGNCDSYTAYRRHSFSRLGLSKQIGRHVLAIGHQIARMVSKLLIRKSSWRLDRARIGYYASRISYDARLVIDESWRDMVKRNNWLARQ